MSQMQNSEDILDKFTDKIADQIIMVVKSRLKHFAEQGINVDLVDTKYSDIYMETKLVFTLAGKNEEAEQERKRFFMENCEGVGLKPEHYGQLVTLPTGKSYTIAGLDFHAEEPVLLQPIEDEGITGFYRMSVLDIKKVI